MSDLYGINMPIVSGVQQPVFKSLNGYYCFLLCEEAVWKCVHGMAKP